MKDSFPIDHQLDAMDCGPTDDRPLLRAELFDREPARESVHHPRGRLDAEVCEAVGFRMRNEQTTPDPDDNTPQPGVDSDGDGSPEVV